MPSKLTLSALLACYAYAGIFAQTSDDRRVSPIVAHKQVALIIGNSAYLNHPLLNPLHDAQAMSRRLRELNFDVTLVTDADRKAMGHAIDQFVDKLGTGDVAFFYYSGHGMQVDGENYLIPVDFQGQNETDVRYDAHPAGRIQERMEKSGAQLNILVLDACRDNPYRSTARGGPGGLAAMSPSRGTFIAFATAPGHTASDNPNGRNGLFTQCLLEALSAPGLSLNDVFDLVREKVDLASNGRQLPWTLSSVVGRYSFLPGVIGGPAPAPPPRPAVTGLETPAPIESIPIPNKLTIEQHHAGDYKINPKDGLRYAWIPPGSFQMGCSTGDNECAPNEKPAHRMVIRSGFWIGQTPVTQVAFLRVTGVNPSQFKGSNAPVDSIDWNQAKAYCNSVGMRLPTEAEWEYAARGGTAESRYGALDQIAWYDHNSGVRDPDYVKPSGLVIGFGVGTKVKRSHDVGSKSPNACGLYDMLGNVLQWTSDWYGARSYLHAAEDDIAGPSKGTDRVLRGGDWGLQSKWVRVSARFNYPPGNRSPTAGFRCVQ